MSSDALTGTYGASGRITNRSCNGSPVRQDVSLDPRDDGRTVLDLHGAHLAYLGASSVTVIDLGGTQVDSAIAFGVLGGGGNSTGSPSRRTERRVAVASETYSGSPYLSTTQRQASNWGKPPEQKSGRTYSTPTVGPRSVTSRALPDCNCNWKVAVSSALTRQYGTRSRYP